MEFIQLGRCFRKLTRAELEDPELLIQFAVHGLGDQLTWEEVVKLPRVVLLAEAGSGKTREMQEQARQLREKGKPAFFIPLDDLGHEEISSLLPIAEEELFKAWKVSSGPAWFFLDSVDELKLSMQKLGRVLAKFRKELEAYLGSIHVVVSCRPSDWQANFDLKTFQIGLQPERNRGATHTPEEEFLVGLSERKPKDLLDVFAADKAPKGREGVVCVTLLPLDERRIRKFSTSNGVNSLDVFISEIRRQNAWIFARRPLDLAALVAIWNQRAQFGSLTELYEINISTGLKDRPDRAGALAERCLREGAERLALALTLTRTREIVSPDNELEQDFSGAALDPADILGDWTEVQRQTLLRRPIFDPATYGRVRFHHRSVQEYLAAKCLLKLLGRGMTIKALLRVLFAEQYGEQVVFPSMREVAVWVAIENGYVRTKLMEREPELFLCLGDPGSLQREVKCQVLRAFCKAYGNGGRRGIGIPFDQITRFASTELGDAIQDLWGSGPASIEVFELLLSLIEAGAMADCSVICKAVAQDSGLGEDSRIKAIRSLAKFGPRAAVLDLVASFQAKSDDWPLELVGSVISDLFPVSLSSASLICLLERVASVNERNRFEYGLIRIAQEADPLAEGAIELRDRLRDLVLRSSEANYSVSSTWSSLYDFVVPALATLCQRQVCLNSVAVSDQLIMACAVANLVGDRNSAEIKRLKNAVRQRPEIRPRVFLSELGIMESKSSRLDMRTRLQILSWQGLIGAFAEKDRDWLQNLAISARQAERREIALIGLFNLWQSRGGSRIEATAIMEMVEGDSRLAELARTFIEKSVSDLETVEAPTRADPDPESSDQGQEAGWRVWREDLLSNPEKSFESTKRLPTLKHLYNWLSVHESKTSIRDSWGRESITNAFSPQVAELACYALKQLWRQEVPEMWSEKAPEDRGTTPPLALRALWGIAAESENDSWVEQLTEEEVKLVAKYSTFSRDAFPAWLKELAVSHRAVVERVLQTELETQLALSGRENYLPLLESLRIAENFFKELLAPCLVRALRDWPNDFESEKTASLSAFHLDTVLQVIHEGTNEHNKEIVTKLCEERISSFPEGQLVVSWTRGLFRYSPNQGVALLQSSLQRLPTPERRADLVTRVLAGLFGQGASSVVDFAAGVDRIPVLEILVGIAHDWVRWEDDQEHSGVFTPDDRDEAEYARSYLLEALINAPGLAAYQALLKLSKGSLVSRGDYIRFRARQRAAIDAEKAPLTPAEFVELEKRHEVPPRSRDELFQVMLDRLDDLEIEIMDHDFTNRETLQSIKKEVEMQRSLALRLSNSARGAYTVTRESEVADNNRTDIVLAAVRGDQKATIEVKIAEKWSLPRLEEALRDQLLGKYLRHETCKAGCLLLTYHGGKGKWNPTPGTLLPFKDVVKHLFDLAKAIEKEQGYSVRLGVVGIDLTDPADRLGSKAKTRQTPA